MAEKPIAEHSLQALSVYLYSLAGCSFMMVLSACHSASGASGTVLGRAWFSLLLFATSLLLALIYSVVASPRHDQRHAVVAGLSLLIACVVGYSIGRGEIVVLPLAALFLPAGATFGMTVGVAVNRKRKRMESGSGGETLH